MGKIAILPAEAKTGDPGRDLLVERSMPVDYTGDFSLVGILVDRLPEAIQLLETSRFEVIAEQHCTQVVTGGLQQVRDLFRVLDDGGIDYRLADLADRIYQG